MDIKKLQRTVVDALEDIKAQDIRVFNTMGQSDLFDRVVVASGTSNRQTKALAASVRDKVKAAGGHIVSIEGEDTGEWVLVDLGDLIVHIMQPGIRTYYNLEELWGAKPVALKPAETGKSTPGVNKPAAKKAPAKKAPAKKTTASKTATRSASKTSAKKAPARKSAAAPRAARKTPVAAKKRTARPS